MNGTDAHSQNPQVQFTEGGLYSVTLVVHSSVFSDSETKIGYIRVGINGLWTGNSSSEWYSESNWDNFFIPDHSTHVLIPGSRPHWPVFDGTFIIGTHCKTITLGDSTSQMTVTGDLIIN